MSDTFFNQCPICWKSQYKCRCAEIKEDEENHKLLLDRHRNDSMLRIEEIQAEIDLAVKKNKSIQFKFFNKILIAVFLFVFIFFCWGFYLKTIDVKAKAKLINMLSAESPDIARKIVSIFKQ